MCRCAVCDARLLQHRPHKCGIHRLRCHKGVDAREPPRRSKRVGKQRTPGAWLATAMCRLCNRRVPHRPHIRPVRRALCGWRHRTLRRPSPRAHLPGRAAQHKGDQLLLPQDDDSRLALSLGRRVVLVRESPFVARSHVEALAVGPAVLTLLAAPSDQYIRLLLHKRRQHARPTALNEEREIAMGVLVRAPVGSEHHAGKRDREPVERLGTHLPKPRVLLERQRQQRAACSELVACDRPRPRQIRVASRGRCGLQLREELHLAQHHDRLCGGPLSVDLLHLLACLVDRSILPADADYDEVRLGVDPLVRRLGCRRQLPTRLDDRRLQLRPAQCECAHQRHPYPREEPLLRDGGPVPGLPRALHLSPALLQPLSTHERSVCGRVWLQQPAAHPPSLQQPRVVVTGARTDPAPHCTLVAALALLRALRRLALLHV